MNKITLDLTDDEVKKLIQKVSEEDGPIEEPYMSYDSEQLLQKVHDAIGEQQSLSIEDKILTKYVESGGEFQGVDMTENGPVEYYVISQEKLIDFVKKLELDNIAGKATECINQIEKAINNNEYGSHSAFEEIKNAIELFNKYGGK